MKLQNLITTTHDSVVLGAAASAFLELLMFAGAAILVMTALIRWVATLAGADEEEINRYANHGFALGIVVLVEILILQYISSL